MKDDASLEARVEELESRLDDLEQIIQDGETTTDVIGMREFVDQVEPSTHNERVLAIAYYLDQHQRQDNFTRADIEKGYRTCRVQKPANTSDVIAELGRKGWVMSDGKEGQSHLRRVTSEGIDKIEEVIDDGA